MESVFVPHNEDKSLTQNFVPKTELSKNVTEKTNTKTDTKKQDTKYVRRKSETKDKSAYDVLKETLGNEKGSRKKLSKKDGDEIIEIKKEINVVTLTPQKIDSDSDCIIVSDGSDIDLGVALKKDVVVLNLKRVKTEKGVTKEETEQITFMNSSTSSARDMM